MAINDNTTAYSAASRRWFFGTNVMVLILLTVAVVVMVNYLGHWKNVRHDVAGGFGGVRLTERGKRVLTTAGKDLRITTVYTSDEPDTDRKKYLPKLQDLCQEIGQFSRDIKVQHLYSGNERAELRDRVQSKFGSAAEKYNEVVTLSKTTWSELTTAVAPVQKEIEALLQSDSWLSGFSTLANIATVLRKDGENLEQTRKEVEDLIHGEGLPRYQEANSKIRTANDDLKKHLEDTQKWMQEMQKLANVLSDPKAAFAVKTREQVNALKGLVAEFKKAAGDPKDASVPEDPRPGLQEFARAAGNLGRWLSEEAARVDLFVKEYPAIQRHPRWLMRVQAGGLPFPVEMQLSQLLSETGGALNDNTQRLRDILRMTDVPKDQLQNVTRQIRNMGVQIEEQLNAWNAGITTILDEGVKLDRNGKDMQFLARGGKGDLFKPVLDKLNDISTKITALPALKIDEIANRLQQDNIVVVENDKDVRVVTFDEVWPVADRDAGRFGMDQEQTQRRIFAGDAPLTSAVLSMQMSKPFATVIFVSYETEPPPQMRQFSRGKNTGPIPLEAVNVVRERLEQANFKVKEWNMGAEGEEAKRPEPEEGTQPVYVLVPPAPKERPNYMMGTTTERGFGEPELKKIKDELAKEGKAIFLCVFEPGNPMMGPPPEYPYDEYLSKDWGIDVQQDYRVIRGVVDKRQPDHYSVNLMQWYYMQMNGFSKDHPVGEPLRSRRVLMREVCPVAKTTATPKNVTLSTILEVPAGRREFWAEKNISRIIQALRSPDGGTFKRSEESYAPPFPVIMAAENSETKGKIVVMGSGMSFRDDYLTQRVMRIEGQGRLATDPPPAENVDLFVNAVYWLCGRQDLIAAGPAEVPVVPQIEAGSQRGLWVASAGWAVAVLIAGGIVMVVRRK